MILNEPLAQALGLDVNELRSQDGAAQLSGNRLPMGAMPIAQAYAGHQYGHFTLLGDGRAALAPMLREYIISEAMHALGIPTTRSLAVLNTGEQVRRETSLTGAVLVRVAASHLRVGTFQFAAQYGHMSDLVALTDYALRRHYSHVVNSEDRALLFLRTVIERQAALIAQWQAVGFVHGVMNTDNTTISGETIDYGPCAFIDTYDPKTVFSSIDQYGRYAYGNQPSIALWNLARFAETLLPLLHHNRGQAAELAQAELSRGADVFRQQWLTAMRAKLGLANAEPEDTTLITQLLTTLHRSSADFTNSFLALTADELDGSALAEVTGFSEWRERWEHRQQRQGGGKATAKKLMRTANPSLIPRNHRVEEALDAACQGDLSVLHRLLDALRNPYSPTPAHSAYAEPSGKPYRTFCGT